ncbi:hypothetical protein [Aromatoleum toluclasticum]|uniref:hypothetical protein n=1 Tax=Aromatoleum toluclasticum TaxID=92003 RepID=UPI0012F75266|nr:hypothetical protein [Aromatoleum toluclasticum]
MASPLRTRSSANSPGRSGPPRWNFHKYVVDRNGKVIASFPSRVEPDSRELREAIERVLQDGKAAVRPARTR